MITRNRAQAARTGVEARLSALAAAADLGAGVVDVSAATQLVARAGTRLGHGVDRTVVALAGATGSGKSSLFNALSGAELSRVGVRRPTTSAATATVWGGDATALLDWLIVPTRHAAPADPAASGLDGLVLLDLPDHDSTAIAHRLEVDRLVELVDLVVWVLDPQKYADRAVHERYLAPMAGADGVLLVVLNQVDRLDPAHRAACRSDLQRLLAADGLPAAEVLAVSARTGDGLPELHGALRDVVRRREAALDRLAADTDRVAAQLAAGCGRTATTRDPARRQLLDALADAAGVNRVAAAVGTAYRQQAAARSGWPPSRWLYRLRPDPLKRLHLGDGGPSTARTSLPVASPVQSARVETAVRDLISDATETLPPDWSHAVRSGLRDRVLALPDRLDRAVAGTDVSLGRVPRWQLLAAALQRVLLVTAAVGAVWLAGLAALAYLQLDRFASPDVGAVPLPTLLLLVGLLGGLLLALLSRRVAAVGGRRRADRARHRLRDAVATVADEELVRPLQAATGRHHDFCAAVRAAAG